MGEPIRIYDFVRLLIAVRGYNPDEDISIKITGLRPGEKLFEEILVDDESTSSTKYNKIFRTKNYLNFDKLSFLNNLSLLAEMVKEEDFSPQDLKNMLKKMISTYVPKEEQIVCKQS